MEQQGFYHALTIRHDVCVGCSHCMKVCPTEALRVNGGKATLYPAWCIDCGECHRVCPTRAIVIEDDDFKNILNYKHRVLIIPSVFIGQFESKIPQEEIFDILMELGFTEIQQSEHSADYLISEINKYIKKHDKPVLSSFCPAVIRLIQIRFPALLDNVLLLKQPLEITTEYYRKLYAGKGIDPNDVGIFYMTPCAAKIASIKAPVGGYASPLDGVLNMNYLYNLVFLKHKQRSKNAVVKAEYDTHVSARGITWSLTNGEAQHIDGKCLAIDGIENVVQFLERLENGKITGVDYLELRACDESCAGGILTPYNRFLAAERLREDAKKLPTNNNTEEEYQNYIGGTIDVGEIPARSMVRYDVDIVKALAKMELAQKLKEMLPNIDCGACGAPSCEALAEDIAREQATINHCIFMKARHEKEGSLSQADSIDIMEKIWGKEKL